MQLAEKAINLIFTDELNIKKSLVLCKSCAKTPMSSNPLLFAATKQLKIVVHNNYI
jgi:hypothetical protein